MIGDCSKVSRHVTMQTFACMSVPALALETLYAQCIMPEWGPLPIDMHSHGNTIGMQGDMVLALDARPGALFLLGVRALQQ